VSPNAHPVETGYTKKQGGKAYKEKTSRRKRR